MDFGSFLILVAFGFLIDIAGVYFQKGIFMLFGMLVSLLAIVTAIQDNASNGGQGFVVSQAVGPLGTYILRYQPLYPLIYIGIMVILLSAVMLIAERKHFV
jgi:hypothetical protein